VLTFQRTRPLFVAAFRLRQIVEQLTGLGIGGARCRALVKAAALDLRRFRLAPNDLRAQRPDEPRRPPRDESTDVLPANQWHVVAEPVTVSVQQPGAMRGFLLTHAVEHSGRRRKLCAEAFGIVGVHALVLFFK